MASGAISHFKRWMDLADKFEEVRELAENLLEDRTYQYGSIQDSDIAGNEEIGERNCNDLTLMAYFIDSFQKFINGTATVSDIADRRATLAKMRRQA